MWGTSNRAFPHRQVRTGQHGLTARCNDFGIAATQDPEKPSSLHTARLRVTPSSTPTSLWLGNLGHAPPECWVVRQRGASSSGTFGEAKWNGTPRCSAKASPAEVATAPGAGPPAR